MENGSFVLLNCPGCGVPLCSEPHSAFASDLFLFFLFLGVGSESNMTEGTCLEKSEINMCLNPENLILRLAEVGLFPPGSGPVCPSTRSLYDPYLCHS